MDWAIYGALIAGFVAVVAAGGYVAVHALEAWQTLKHLRRELGQGLERLADAGERSVDAVGAATDTAQLQRSLERLRASQARLTVLREAWDEATGVVRAVAAVYPRK